MPAIGNFEGPKYDIAQDQRPLAETYGPYTGIDFADSNQRWVFASK
jgi:hypothetical protein